MAHKNIIKQSTGESLFDVLNIILLSFITILCLYPVWHVTMASLSNGNLLLAHSGPLIAPLGFSIQAYQLVFKDPMIVKGYINTVFVVSAGLVVNLLLTSVAAFILSRRDLYFKNAIMAFVVFTMFFSGGLIPLYLTVKGIGLLDNLWALILPQAIITQNLIIMRTNFMAIPDSLEESAKLDGANDFILLFRIILPLSMPVISVMVIYYGVYHWNAWFNAMIFLSDRMKFPLQLILREILLNNAMEEMASGTPMHDSLQVSESIKYATIMVATLPIMLIYPFLQKYFVKGVMVGALKG